MTYDKYKTRRYLLFSLALFINTLGIAYITKASLGTSPITSVTYVASMFTPLSMGQWTIILNLLFVLFELPLLTRQELKADLTAFLLQIPITFFFGFCIDFSMFLLSWLEPVAYASQIFNLLVGCVILAVGIALEVKADAALMVGEYFVRAIARRFRKDFGYVKLGFDSTLVVLACLMSFCFIGGLHGVREGTAIAALVVGPIVHFITPYYRFIDSWIGASGNSTATQAAPVHGARHCVITIAREFGSGGHLLGEMLAKELGIRLYDKEFIHMAAQRSGIDEDYIARNEQSIPSFWLKCIMGAGSETSRERSLSPDDVLFVAESKIVRELAEKGPCVIVGRLADFVLRDSPSAIKVFCYSDRQHAITRCVEQYGIPQDKAAAEIAHVNRNRVSHYEYYTGTKWGDPHHYDILVNTGSMGLTPACQFIKELYLAATGSKGV